METEVKPVVIEADGAAPRSKARLMIMSRNHERHLAFAGEFDSPCSAPKPNRWGEAKTKGCPNLASGRPFWCG